jgi:hypothetical protein
MPSDNEQSKKEIVYAKVHNEIATQLSEGIKGHEYAGKRFL